MIGLEAVPLLWIVAAAIAVVGGFVLITWVTLRRLREEADTSEEPSENVPEATLPESISPAESVPEIVQPEDAVGETTEEEAEQEDVPAVPVSVHASFPTLDDISEEQRDNLTQLISELPKLPRVSLDLLPILSQRGAGTKEVASVIERDQTTAARLLRWVNSSLFGLQGKVDSLHRAVTLLGLDTVRSAVLEDSFARAMVPEPLDGLAARTIWRHTAAASLVARHLARSVRGVAPDVAATAGLLHDIGLLLLLTTEPKKLEVALGAAREAREPLIAHEEEALGYNHQALGECFVRAWQLPESIADAIGKHHSPLKEPFDPLAGVLWLTDYLVSSLGFPCPEDQMLVADEEEIADLMERTGLRPPLDRYCTDGLAKEMLRASWYWHLEQGEVPEEARVQ